MVRKEVTRFFFAYSHECTFAVASISHSHTLFYIDWYNKMGRCRLDQKKEERLGPKYQKTGFKAKAAEDR